MFCTKCGKESAEGTKFCGGCGSTIQVEDYVSETSAVRPNEGEIKSRSLPVEVDDKRAPDTADDFQNLSEKPFHADTFIPRLISHLLPSGRTGREMFLLSLLSIFFVWFNFTIVVGYIHYSIDPYASDDDVIAIPVLLWLFIGVPLIFFQVIKRLHDRGKSAVHLLLYLIPLWHLVEWYKAFLIKGEPLSNKYGTLPSGISESTRLIVWIFIIVSLFVILWLNSL
jgi:uncharacterized membrane protein YhaH (DUF805 family)